MAFSVVCLLAVTVCLMGIISCTLDKSHVGNREHLKEHLRDLIDLDHSHGQTKGQSHESIDLDKMSADELKFYYFTVHDVEGNDKLDGCELVQSLLHFHTEESFDYGMEPRSLSDAELSVLVDSVLLSDDKNFDGFIDYSEFSSGQISKGL